VNGKAKRNEKPVIISARVEGNNGDVAFCCATNDNIFNITRGHSAGVLDMFPDEFKAKLPVGHKFPIVTDDVHYWYQLDGITE
jgi:hypothetical protein